MLNPTQPQNSPLGQKKVKNDLKIMSKSNVRIEGNIENESCSTTQVDLTTVFKPYANPKIAHEGSKKSKLTPKLGQNQMSELVET